MNIAYTQPAENATRVTFREGNVHGFGEDRSGVPVLHVGIGEMDKVTRRTFMLHIRKAIRLAREHEVTELAFDCTDALMNTLSLDDGELGRLIAENALMAHYEFTRYKTLDADAYQGIETLYIQNATPDVEVGVQTGLIVAEAVNLTRDLANTPGADMTPTVLAEAAKKAAQDTPVTVQVLEKKDAEKLGMGLVLGVDRGSAEPMKFIVMEYWGTAQSTPPTVLIGKGITFDTGGLNLKPSEHIGGMEGDMTGGAAVIASIVAAAKLGIQKNIVALVPAVENAISGNAMRPGDVLTAMNKSTVEVGNTDAEGRLVLGDALTYAERYNPALVVDIATLTGGATIVLGPFGSPFMTKDETLQNRLQELGEVSGDYLWPLPLWDEYRVDIKGDKADLKNDSGKRDAQTIVAGMFLAEFAKPFTRWAHIDIASRFQSVDSEHLAKGSVGAPVRLLVRLLEAES